MITISNLQKSFKAGNQQIEVLKGIHLAIQRGSMVSIMGRSGSGKSTLLNIIAGLEKGTGKYLFDNQNISEKNLAELSSFRRKHVGIVLQNYTVCDYKNIYENIALPLRYSKVKNKEISNIVNSLAGQLGLNHLLDRFPDLSGGELQRVAIARALIQDPDLILADEPTGSLDEETERDILSIFEMLNKMGKTVIMVTHDVQVANTCHRNLIIKDGTIHEKIS